MRAQALAALLLVTALRLGLGSQLGLAADEAYYWCWSQALDWGYFDHPPAVAWVIAAGQALFGRSELGVRGGGVLLGALVMGACVWSHLRPTRVALLLLSAPLFALGGLLATPDVPLVCAWLGAVVAAERRIWWLLGLCCGAAMLSKHTGYLLFPAVFLGSDRRWPGLYAAGALALGMATPNLAWDGARGWVSLGFQLNHGLGPQADAGGLGELGLFWLAQLGLLGPVLGGAAIAWVIGGARSRGVAWWAAVLPLAVVAVSALRGHVEANWAAPAWIAALWGLASAQERLDRVAWMGGVSSAILSLAVAAQALSPTPTLPQGPLDQLRVGQTLAQSVEAWGLEPVICARYQEAAWIRFYGDIDATTAPDRGRRTQFDLWPRELPDRTVFVRQARRSTELATDGLYAQRGDFNEVVVQRGARVIGVWQVVPVSGLIGGR